MSHQVYAEGDNDRIRYIAEYLTSIGCKVILEEEEYVDRDYLDDFATYYVKSFHPYKRFCKRLHFFKQAFSQKDFDTLLLEKKGSIDPISLQESYLGYLVVRPLPHTCIGRTSLAPYSHTRESGGFRLFPTCRDYVAHIGGFELRISSLAFQEQDSVVAACATTALWSAFQKIGPLFQTVLPTPAEITNYASRSHWTPKRAIPSKGLNVFQMAQAIGSFGLEVEMREASNVKDLKGLLYGYGAFGLPIILGIDLFRNGEFEGKHAVTVAGFGLDGGRCDFQADRMFQVYVHDDQVGPFARMEFTREVNTLTSEWGGPGTTAKLFCILIPVYEKIRITYEQAKTKVGNLVSLLSRLNPEIEWDIRLSTVNDLRKEYFERGQDSGEIRKKMLYRSWPRFIWRITGRTGEALAIDMILDATDAHTGDLLEEIVIFDSGIKEILRSIVSDIELKSLLSEFWQRALERHLS